MRWRKGSKSSAWQVTTQTYAMHCKPHVADEPRPIKARLVDYATLEIFNSPAWRRRPHCRLLDVIDIIDAI